MPSARGKKRKAKEDANPPNTRNRENRAVKFFKGSPDKQARGVNKENLSESQNNGGRRRSLRVLNTHQNKTGHSPVKRENSRLHSPVKRENSRLHSPVKKEDSKIHSPLKRENSRLHSPVKRGDSKIHSPVKRENSRIHSPVKREDSKIHSPVKREDSKLQSPAKRENSRLHSPVKREDSRLHSPVKREDSLTSDVSDDESENESRVSYEERRQSNLQANAVFLAKLGIHEAQEALRKTLQKAPISKPTQRGLKREKSPPPPRRASLRIRRIDPDGIALPEIPVLLSNIEEEKYLRKPAGPLPMRKQVLNKNNEHLHDSLLSRIRNIPREKGVQQPRKPSGSLSMEEHSLHKKDHHDNLLSHMKKISKDKTTVTIEGSNLNSFMEHFSKIEMTAERVAKVVPDRIFSMAVHPAEEKVLTLTGDKWGKVGIWDVMSKDPQDGVVAYDPHSRPVVCLKVPSWNHHKLFSCSYDGTLRCCDFNREVFNEVYSTPDDHDNLLRWFDFIDEHTMLVAQQDGCVSVVDTRTDGCKAEHEYALHHKSVRTVDIHPIERHYIVTSSPDGVVSIWDFRNLKKKNSSISDMRHGKGVHGAFFSPVTGNSILTTSLDDRLSIYNFSKGQTDLKKAISHNNHTGRWLTPFKAMWHPARDDLFVVGSMARPRQIEVFDNEGNLLKAFKDPFYLASVCSLNAIHPTRDIIAGGNSSGRVHVFM